MNGKGFLGTNASVLADLSLVLGIVVALMLTVGMLLAVTRRYNAHRWVQTVAVSLNVVQVLAIMVASFFKSAAPGIPQKLNEPFYSAALIHAALGFITLIFGTFVMLRGNKLVPQALRFKNYKLFMRTAYALYIAVTLLGVWVYSVWYVNNPEPATAAGGEAQPVAQKANELNVPMLNFEFNPKEVVVPVGATVVWVNQDGAPHTATADDGALFKSDLLSKGQSFKHTFDKAGEFPYFCELHGSAGGQDMAGIIKVVPADQAPPLVAAVPQAAAPTPQPTPNPLPVKYFGQPSGTAAFRDDKGRSDQIAVSLRVDTPPPSGQTLFAFLTTLDGSATQPLGPLAIDGGGGATGTFNSPDGSNLAARFNRFVVSQEPAGSQPAQPSGQPIFEGVLPGQASQFLTQLLANGPGLPTAQGYITGIRLQTDELARHAKFLADAKAAGDLAGVKRHAEHVYNLIAGSLDAKFGDLDGDGRSQNPGDGFGLLQNGAQNGYLRAAGDAATAAKNAPDASDSVKAHSEHVLICAQNMQEWAVEARTLALQLAQSTDLAATGDAITHLGQLSQWIQRGDDANGDGEIAPVPGEGGGVVAYEHAQFMAGFGLFPFKAASAPGEQLAFAVFAVQPATSASAHEHHH
jgi:plastocyanin